MSDELFEKKQVPFFEALKSLLRISRWRYWSFLILPVVVIAVSMTGPDGWREVASKLLWVAWTSICITLAYLARKALFEYISGKDAYKKAMETPEGASRVVQGICILTGMIFLGIVNYAKAEEYPGVPAKAVQLAAMVNNEIDKHWPTMPRRSYMGSLIEKETCPSLTHKYCWDTIARLKTSREEGAGLGQFTRAWDQSGALRFDAVAEVKSLAPKELSELSWDNIYTRADLSVRAIIVKQRDCLKRLMWTAKDMDAFMALTFCDSAYNGGYGGMMNDRKLCHLTANCNPNVWFGNVENTSNKNRTKWQGYGDSAFDINRKHVRYTIPMEPPSYRPKYILLFGV